MTTASDQQASLETVVMLAEQIARTSPESAEQAMQIIRLVQDLAPPPDRASIRDAIDVETADTDLSDAKVQTTAEAVMRVVRADP